MDIGIAIERASRVQVVMIAGHDIEITGFETFRGALALSFERSHLHRQAVLFEKAALLHYFPQRHMTRRTIVDSDFLGCHLLFLLVCLDRQLLLSTPAVSG